VPLSARPAAPGAWGRLGAFLVIALATTALVAAGRGGDDFIVFLALGYPLVGAIVASRQPANTVGWLLAIGILLALGSLVDANIRSASAPALELSAWLSEWAWYGWLICAACVLPLVFPNGRLVSRRWRPVLWLAVVALLASVGGAAFAPGPLDVDSARPIDNPVGIEGAGDLLSVIGRAGDVLATAAFLLAGASLVVRFRRSGGTERQQLKWFAYVALLALAGLAVAMFQVLFGTQPGESEGGGWVDTLGAVGWFTALITIGVGIPVATGMAILRHRLYDIDVVIRRTLVYGTLTMTLAASYVGSVLLLQLALSPLTEDSGLAVAGSTLAVAALFRPAGARIRAAVDRRFYRSKYDATRTVAAFGARLRDEVELDSLSAELQATVVETMQPAHVSLWLRPEAGR
jgi:hypothetical protein